MKDLVIAHEIKKQVQEAAQKLHEMCVENNVPVVMGICLGSVDDGEETHVEKLVCANIDAEIGVFEPTIFAAAEVLQLERVPLQAVLMLRMMREMKAAQGASVQ